MNKNLAFNHVSPYFASRDYLTVYTGHGRNTERTLYKFAQDLETEDRKVIYNRVKDDPSALVAFLACGDLLKVKAKS